MSVDAPPSSPCTITEQEGDNEIALERVQEEAGRVLGVSLVSLGLRRSNDDILHTCICTAAYRALDDVSRIETPRAMLVYCYASIIPTVPDHDQHK